MSEREFNLSVSEDTIVALSSGLPSAIAIVRISGSKTKFIIDEVFLSKQKLQPNKMIYGKLKTKLKDNVLVCYFKAPNSYTGEDMAEIYTHGSRPIIDCLISEIIFKGARMAYNGEFTLRGFLYGKMDLTAVEGITSLLNAQSHAQAQSSYKLLNGDIKNLIENKQNQLINILAQINADLDYPEENTIIENEMNIKNQIHNLKEEIFNLKESYNRGRLINDGVKIVLCGDVNVGKSSIINALLNKDRMIVSNIGGTTRDIVEDYYFFNGHKFILVDTAGIRLTTNKIESEGIKRAKQALNSADIILNISDNYNFLDISNINKNNNKILKIKNKCDLDNDLDNNLNCDLDIKNSNTNFDNILKISAKDNINIDKLKLEIYNLAFKNDNSDKFDENIDIITDFRHYNCLDLCYNCLCEAYEQINNNLADCVAMILNEAYNYLGQITGIIGNEEIISEIFKNFCVGK